MRRMTSRLAMIARRSMARITARADARILEHRGILLVVSCEPVPGGPTDRTDFVVALAAADAGEPGAVAAVGAAVDALAAALRDVQMLLAPDLVVLEGGLGPAAGFRARLAARLAVLPDLERPTVVPARLGRDAGLVGAAALLRDRLDA